MKRFIIALSSLLIMPAFAEVAPIYYDYDEDIEYIEDGTYNEFETDYTDIAPENIPVTPVATPTVQQPATAAQTTGNARAATPRTTSRAISSNVSNPSSRTITQRPLSTRTTATAQTRGDVTGAPSRAIAGQNQNIVSRRATVPNTNTTRTTVANPGVAQNTNTARATVTNTDGAQNTNTARAATIGVNTARNASLTQTDTVNSPLYTGRVSARSNATNVSIRTPTVLANTNNSNTSNITNAAATQSLDEIAKMTDYCKVQYTQCMDGFCDTLDSNQGRCSCSANIKNYTKSETTLKEATDELQIIAQKIQYIGLTKDEISTLFTQTEAELAMQGRTDTTPLKLELDKVKNMIIDVKTANTSSNSGFNFDLSGLMDLTFDDTGFDLGILFGSGGTANSISNQRGTELFKTASTRCKATVLDTCRGQGIDTTIITNSYDLEIDKQCIVYERSLTDANAQMLRMVRNGKNVLEKARLVVAQQKNSYDLRGCLNALDTCMQDEFVCDSDYENCLDPSGKYIVNGDIVIGSEPGVSGGNILPTTPAATGIYTVWNYTLPAAGNPWGQGTLGEFIKQYIGAPAPIATNMVGFLQQKIGYNATGKNYGLCISVLNKCQAITYVNDIYQRDNKTIDGWLQRTLVHIKASQDNILAKHAENCIGNVMSCLASNGWANSASSLSQQAAERACDAIIRTCASVTGNSKADVIAAATGQ